MEQLLSVKEVAGILKLSKRQVFRLRNQGFIPAALKIGGSVRWRLADIEEWVTLGCPDRKTFEAIS